MARLLDGFTALFSFGLELDASLAAGRVERLAGAARREALALLEAARATAAAQGQDARRIESASFAVAAWFDEILARVPGADEVTSLQFALFNSSNAHSEFFHHLAALGADDDEVREVYWYALANGFKGQYYFETGDDGELEKLKTLHGLQLRTAPLDLEALADERLTPQPYGLPDPAGPRWPLRRERALVRAGGALALLVPCVFLMALLWRGTPPVPAPSAQRLERQLRSHACGELSAAAADGRTRVGGLAASPDDLARVRRAVTALTELKGPVFDLRLRAALPSPFADTAGRPPFELASACLARLRESLAANAGGDRLVAELLFLETLAR